MPCGHQTPPCCSHSCLQHIPQKSINKHVLSAMMTLIHVFYGKLKVIRKLQVEIRLETLLISIVFDILERNMSLMDVYFVLAVWGQQVHSEAAWFSSKRDNIISAQHSLHHTGASRWRLHLAGKLIAGDSPTQLQNSTTCFSPRERHARKPSHPGE